MKKWNRALACILLACIPLTTLYGRSVGWTGDRDFFRSISNHTFSQSLEQYVQMNLPMRRSLTQMGLDIRLTGGNLEQNGIFISSSALIKNIQEPRKEYVEQNTAAVLELGRYASALGQTVCFTLVPSAAAVSRQNLPPYSEPFDQQEFIDGVYSNLAGVVPYLDSYSALVGKREQYIYYRTEDNLTAMGGYYLYTAMARRLLGMDNPSLDQYDILYLKNGYYGDLYRYSPYKDVASDTLIAFAYSRNIREYTVTHTMYDGDKTYHTLFVEHILDMEQEMDVYLGGLSAVVDIESSAPSSTSLLVFGDKTALSYLPFLANHYRRVTLVDLSQDPNLYSWVDMERYDQVLIAYGVEFFGSTTYPSRLTLFIDE